MEDQPILYEAWLPCAFWSCISFFSVPVSLTPQFHIPPFSGLHTSFLNPVYLTSQSNLPRFSFGHLILMSTFHELHRAWNALTLYSNVTFIKKGWIFLSCICVHDISTQWGNFFKWLSLFHCILLDLQ